MSRIRAANSGQLFLIPSEFGFWLREDHPARFFNEFVEEKLDLSKFISGAAHGSNRGRPAYDHVMLTKVILYGYSTGLTSAREIADACHERIDFRFLAGGLQPKFRTISSFRKKNLSNFSELFEQVLDESVKAGLVTMGSVAFDGSKVLANASKRKAMSYERMTLELQRVHQELQALKAEKQSASKTKQKKLEKEIDFKRERLTKIQTAKIELEERIMQEKGLPPEAKDQRNFTDPESRIMKKGSGFEQCYNAQAAVDKNSQIIVAAFVTQACNDKQMLEPLVREALENTGILPDTGLADAGFFSEATIKILSRQFPGTNWLVPPEKMQGQVVVRGRIPKDISTADRMRRALSTKIGKAAYGQRKAIVEPVFGQIKEAGLEFRRFSFRGFQNAHQEWMLVCAVHNMLKLMRQWQRSKTKKRRPKARKPVQAAA